MVSIDTEASIIEDFVLYEKSSNVLGKETLSDLPEERAVYAIFGRIHGRPANCRYVAVTNNLRQSIRGHFNELTSEPLAEFTRSIKTKTLRYQLLPDSTDTEVSSIEKEWIEKFRPTCVPALSSALCPPKRITLDDTEEYWLRKLAGKTPLNLATDFGPSVKPEGGIQTFRSIVDATLRDSLEKIALAHGASLHQLMLAAYNILLHQHTSQEDIVVGSHTTDHLDIKAITGALIPVRTFLKNEKSFIQLLEETKQSMLEAHGRQHYRFENLIQRLNKEGQSADSLIETVFSSRYVAGAEELDVLPRRSDGAWTKIIITLVAIETPEHVYLNFEFASDKFKPGTIGRLAERYIGILESIEGHPDLRIGDIEILSKKERHLLLEFNNTVRPFPKASTVPQLFEDKVKEIPDKVAAICNGQALTYLQLNARANCIARKLRSEGIRTGEIIAVVTDRSLDMLATLLGIMKAGGAYLPIDPAYPEARIAFMLRDSMCSTLVTNLEQFAKSRVEFEGRIIFFDNTFFEGDSSDLKFVCTPHSLAYVIYTSGSTGQPKGVMIEHAGLVNFLLSISTDIDFSTVSSILAITTISFDIAYLELYLPLVTGGHVIITDADVSKDAYGLINEIKKYNPTHLQATPSRWDMLVECGWMNDGNAKILTGGEALKENTKESLTSIGEVWNLYGPTETTIWSTVGKVSTGEKISIGKPIANTQIHILNDNGQLCPIGVPGEIYIAGAGLARGYLNRQQLTEERFLWNAFTKDESRMYKTGDLGRWLENGYIEHLGRADDQIKIHGYRIELGEIEHALLQSGLAKKATVVVKTDSADHQLLVGYVVPEGSFNRDQIIAYLKGLLPEYMVPALFVEMKELPLTASGKVDKKMLPAPEFNSLDNIYEGPRNAVEQRLVYLWCQLLGASRIGMHDSFFERGGHSVKAISLVSKVRREFNVKIKLKTIFANPTIAALAKIIIDAKTNIFTDTALDLKTGLEFKELTEPLAILGDQEDYEVSYLQRVAYLCYLMKKKFVFNINFAIKFENPNAQLLEKVILEIIDRHEALRMVFFLKGNEIRQKICPSVPPDFKVEHIDISEANNGDAVVQEIYLSSANKQFDYERGPLIDVKIVKISDTLSILLFAMPHANGDASSLRILQNEILRLYNAYRRGIESPLAPVVCQQKDYALWNNNLLRGETGAKCKDFYVAKISKSLSDETEDVLSGKSEPLESFSYKDQIEDEIRGLVKEPKSWSFYSAHAVGLLGRVKMNRGGTYTTYIRNDHLSALKKLAFSVNSSFGLAVMATFAMLFYKLKGRRQIRMDVSTTTRVREEFENIIGWLTGGIIPCIRVEDEMSIRSFLSYFSDEILETSNYRYYPVERLMEHFDLPLQVIAPIQLNFNSVSENNEITEFKTFHGKRDKDVSYDFKCVIESYSNGARLKVSYNRRFYSPSVIDQMFAEYFGMLTTIIQNPESLLKDLRS
jgi:amino acid adenylation domain-containing protein